MKYIITEQQYKRLTEMKKITGVITKDSEVKVKGGNIPDNQKRLREYIKILKENSDLENINFFIRYFIIIHNFLHMEEKYSDLIKMSNKELNKYLNLPKLKNVDDIIDKFYELYDLNSKVRFAAETLNSIDEVNEFISDKPNFFDKIYYKI